ncbi:glycosyltransferase family 2 protein [Metabacillus endolithicus]|uniref:Glycosyltransferase family 2 protein n=1 Tax=Metabacillus endolithicus TaxID=1535204 RepID=A0ABW5BWK5_9BACI|nr:glycosyltransferase [Metabacillus endolithicus]UPG64501.1 glycosyltransferase [Metabacillus endolithicus]
MPTISIIIPIYNVEKYLAKCLDSVLAQTFTDFELILVNDGSPDNCGVICDEYEKKDDRIIVIHKENGGLSSARNAGINVAQGEYIAFVDSDDFIHERMYEILHEAAKNLCADIVICDVSLVREDEVVDKKCNINDKIRHFSNIEALHQIYTPHGINFIMTVNKLYKRNLFNNIAFEKGRIHEDEIIAHQLLYECAKISYLPINLYYYTQTNNSITRSSFNINKLDALYAFKQRILFFIEIKQISLQQKAESFYIHTFFDYLLKVKKSQLVSEKDFKLFKKNYSPSLLSLLRNPLYSIREKILWALFIINPYFYELHIKIKDRKLLLKTNGEIT